MPLIPASVGTNARNTPTHRPRKTARPPLARTYSAARSQRSSPTLRPRRLRRRGGPNDATDLVADRVAHDRGRNRDNDEHGQVHLAAVGEEASDDQRGLAREDEPDERRRFGAGEPADDDVGPWACEAAEGVDDILQHDSRPDAHRRSRLRTAAPPGSG